MILGSAELKLQLNRGILEPYCGKAIEGSGLEVRVDRLAGIQFGVAKLCVATKKSPEPQNIPTFPAEDGDGDGWILDPGTYYLLTTVERIHMPCDLTGLITPRSTLQRCGVGLFVANIAPGYNGELTFGIVNFRPQAFYLERLSRVALIQFAELKEQELEDCYNGNYQGGKVATDGEEVHIKGVSNSSLVGVCGG